MFIIALIVEYFHKNVSRETFFYWYFIGYIVFGEIEYRAVGWEAGGGQVYGENEAFRLSGS